MTHVETFATEHARDGILIEVRHLLDGAFNYEFSDDDWDHTLGGLHVVVVDDGDVVAHAAVVERTIDVDDRPFRTGYVEGVGTLPSRHNEGFGSLAVARLTEEVRRSFEMGALSTDRHSFYERLGWERWRGPSYVRDGPYIIRTEDEDEGLMVLRFGRSAEVNLASSITCEARQGDDW